MHVNDELIDEKCAEHKVGLDLLSFIDIVSSAINRRKETDLSELHLARSTPCVSSNRPSVLLRHCYRIQSNVCLSRVQHQCSSFLCSTIQAIAMSAYVVLCLDLWDSTYLAATLFPTGQVQDPAFFWRFEGVARRGNEESYFLFKRLSSWTSSYS